MRARDPFAQREIDAVRRSTTSDSANARPARCARTRHDFDVTKFFVVRQRARCAFEGFADAVKRLARTPDKTEARDLPALLDNRTCTAPSRPRAQWPVAAGGAEATERSPSAAVRRGCGVAGRRASRPATARETGRPGRCELRAAAGTARVVSESGGPPPRGCATIRQPTADLEAEEPVLLEHVGHAVGSLSVRLWLTT